MDPGGLRRVWKGQGGSIRSGRVREDPEGSLRGEGGSRRVWEDQGGSCRFGEGLEGSRRVREGPVRSWMLLQGPGESF